SRLCRAAREEDPGALVTYVNFPPTEYLRLSDFDLLSFNVYLERREDLERYLGRLQNLADERPLLMAEIGLDSRRNGADARARSCSRGPTSGTAGATRSSTGTSASRRAPESPSPRLRPCARRSPPPPSTGPPNRRPSPWRSAPTTARRRCGNASRASRSCATPTTR